MTRAERIAEALDVAALLHGSHGVKPMTDEKLKPVVAVIQPHLPDPATVARKLVADPGLRDVLLSDMERGHVWFTGEAEATKAITDALTRIAKEE